MTRYTKVMACRRDWTRNVSRAPEDKRVKVLLFYVVKVSFILSNLYSYTRELLTFTQRESESQWCWACLHSLIEIHTRTTCTAARGDINISISVFWINQRRALARCLVFVLSGKDSNPIQENEHSVLTFTLSCIVFLALPHHILMTALAVLHTLIFRRQEHERM